MSLFFKSLVAIYFIHLIKLFIVIPQLSSAGGRLVISSDGVWDALTFEMALNCCRGLPAHASAAQIVKVPYRIICFTIFLKKYW